MMKKSISITALLLVLSIGLVACSSAPSSSTYKRTHAGAIHEVKLGQVISVRNVAIEPDHTEIGNAAGTILGGIAGSTAGEGAGKLAATTIGAVVGGIVGSKVDRGVQTQPGYEITVRLEGGKIVAISQLADEQFKVGDQVKVIEKNGAARVTH
jgi:outer membrane lipoprotein SlyB